MPARSPSVDRICSVAVQHFAQRGYDAASLNDIATDVGIRKASLYTHFDSKDALFLEVFQDALAIETEFARAAFAAETRRAQPGSRYCAALRERLDASPYLRFLLRAAYLPPAALREHVQAGYEGYVEGLRAAFQAQLRERYPELSGRDVTQFGEAWLGIVDSLHVELIYAEGRQFAARLKAMQRLLADSLAAA